jgi:hypothetical protein
MRSTKLALIAFLATAPLAASAQTHHGHGASLYAGQEARPIKSLSEDDIAELRRGGGWGLAKAAELNGVPGPAHLLELKNEIPLDAKQVAAIEAIYKKMRSEAIAEGERLIALERELETMFRERTVTDERLKAKLAQIEASRSTLRYIHLSTHLETPVLLTRAQIDRYNQLRGYGNDPCANVPAGHDATMWRKHNNCD